MQTTKNNVTGAEDTASPQFSIPAEYELIRQLGVGGTSVVSLVRRISDGRLLALKRPLDQDTDFEELAKREIQVTEKLNLPAIVTVRELSPGSPKAGLLMPHLPGSSLDQLSEELEPLALMNLLSAISISLYYLNLKGVVHGDLKPHNVFLPAEATEKTLSSSHLFYPRIIDFSMAHEYGRDSKERFGIGTLGFAAPETLDEKPLTHQSDLFSFGVMAYTLATGSHPFITDSADPAQISAAVKEETPKPICISRPDFPAELVELIDSLLQKSPTLRPQSGFTVCESLEKLGATYPFRRAIQPRHLLPLEQSGDISTISVMPGLDLPARNELFRISDGDVVKLRFILDANFRLGNLRWSEGVICSTPGFGNYHWSNRLRRKEYELFSALTLIEARWMIKCAIVGGSSNMILVEDPPPELRPGVVTPSLVEALRHKLSDRTYRTQGLRIAEKLQSAPTSKETLELSASLFIRAGEIDRGSTLTVRYCDMLAEANREVEALPLLQRATKLASELGDHNHETVLLHRDGDIRKALGDLIGAEARYKRLLEVAGDKPSRLLAETYKDLGDLHKLKQEYAAGLEALKLARELYQRFEDLTELARVENNLGNLHIMNSDYPQALLSYRRSLKLHRGREHAANIASTVDNIASTYAFTGRISRAIRLYTICLKLKREVGNQGEIARTLNNLGYTLWLQGGVTKALEALEEALKINLSLGSKKESLYNLENLGACAITAGRFAEALNHIRDGRDTADELRDKPSKTALDLSLAKVFTRTGLWKQAERLALRTEKTSHLLGDKTLTIQSLLQLAELRKRQAIQTESVEFAKRALQIAREIDDRQGVAQALMLMIDEDSKNAQEALALADEIGSPRDIAQAAITLAESCWSHGDSLGAKRSLIKAAHYFDSVDEDLDLPRYHKMNASLIMARNDADVSGAVENLSSAIDDLHTRQDKSELWTTNILLGEACLRTGELERAFTALSSATRTVTALVKELPNETHSKGFLNQPEITKMAGLILALRKKLNLT